MNALELEQYIPTQEFLTNKEEPIGEGADSDVYKYGDNVVKVYKDRTPPISLTGLLLYWDITNQLAERFDKDKKIYEVNINGKTYEYSLSINPILLAGKNPHNPDQLISVSKFVDGPHLTGNYPKNIPFSTREFSDPVSNDLEDLSYELDKEFGVYGISIVPPNVKINFQQDKIHLTITDLCSNLWALTKTDNSISPKQ